jgi:hypothetical protein
MKKTEEEKQNYEQCKRLLKGMETALEIQHWAVVFRHAMDIAECARDQAWAEHKDVFGFE